MYSVDANKVITFPRFRGTNSSPAWSPDGSKLMFSSSMLGNPEIFVSDANGGAPKRLTFANGASTSPAWNPKTGQSVVYVSDRGGIPKLYMMDADDTNSASLIFPTRATYRSRMVAQRRNSSPLVGAVPTIITISMSWTPASRKSSIDPRSGPQRTPKLGSRRPSHRL